MARGLSFIPKEGNVFASILSLLLVESFGYCCCNKARLELFTINSN
jgi:hypothetical protein